MMLPLPDLAVKHGMQITGIVHAGAHKGQEAPVYAEMGVDRVMWIEAMPDMYEQLEANLAPWPGQFAIGACVSDEPGKLVEFHVSESTDGSNEGQSSSVLELGTHARSHPDVKFVQTLEMLTTTVDQLLATYWEPEWPAPNMLVMDLQGYEGSCMLGAEKSMEHFDFVYSEVNVDELYRDCTRLPQMDRYLVSCGLQLVAIKLAGCQRRDCSDGGNRWVGWGDGLWVRTDDPVPFERTHPVLARNWFGTQRRVSRGG